MTKFNIVINPAYEHLRQQITSIIEGIVPDDAKIIYRGRNTLYRTHIGGNDIVVKDFKTPNFINRWIYTRLRKSKARRSYENALRMIETGFLSPEPVAYGEEIKNGKLNLSYYLSLNLEGASELRNWTEIPGINTLLPAFAAEIFRLHRAGIYHRDFSPGNILFTGDAQSGYKFHYVDANRINFNEHNPKVLYRMFRSIQWPNLDETKHLARLYAEAASLDPKEMELIAEKEYEGYKKSLELRTSLKRIFKKKR